MELDQLLSLGVFEHVVYSQWIPPILPVVKEDGTFRIYGDCNVNVSQVAVLDNYHVLRTEDLLATCN